MIGRVEVSDREIADAVAVVEDEMLEILCRLVEAPTTLGNEEPGRAEPPCIWLAVHALGLASPGPG